MQGELKLKGTIRYPKARYLSMTCVSGVVKCDDVFDSIVVFEHAEWNGKDGAPLPLKKQRTDNAEA
jgi:hypothetical protein